MNISIEPELARFIEDQVREGRYDSAAAAVNAAISRAKIEAELLAGDLDDDDLAAIEEGLAQLNRGEGPPWEAVKADLKAKYPAL